MTFRAYHILLLHLTSYSLGQNCPFYRTFNIPQFGDNCQYRCRCINDEQCDRATGNCLNGCALGWMGPGCQYRNIVPFNDGTWKSDNNGSVSSLAIDGNISTCSKSFLSSEQHPWWGLNFPRNYYIVGMVLKTHPRIELNVRVEGSNDTEFNSTNVCYQTISTGHHTELELMCRQTMIVKNIRIVSFATVLELCEVEVYGGRYISFKGTVNQSSTFIHWPLAVADNAVDGRPMLEGDDQESVAESTCAVTENHFYNIWRLYLSDNVLLQGIYVYGRRLSHNPEYVRQIQGFSVYLHMPNATSPLIYTEDPVGHSWTDYQPRVIDFESPVITNEIHIQQKLGANIHFVLCEVEVFAECEEGKCGWNCSEVCHCSTITTGTHRRDGTCPYGCMKQWTGQNNKCDIPCDNNMYGASCRHTCGKCRDNEQCNVSTGQCPGDCEPGWKAGLCNEPCDNYMYGAYCKSTCGKCRDNQQCDVVTGHCPGECEPGWKTGICNEPCDNNRYGANCSLTCGKCRNSELCDLATGQCPWECEPGWKGRFCTEFCPLYTYGDLCQERCGVCKENQPCNTTSGECLDGCEPDYHGKLCKKSEDKCLVDSFAKLIIGILSGIIICMMLVQVLYVIYQRRKTTVKCDYRETVPDTYTELRETNRREANQNYEALETGNSTSDELQRVQYKNTEK